jgi:hypothetical protein
LYLQLLHLNTTNAPKVGLAAPVLWYSFASSKDLHTFMKKIILEILGAIIYNPPVIKPVKIAAIIAGLIASHKNKFAVC